MGGKDHRRRNPWTKKLALGVTVLALAICFFGCSSPQVNETDDQSTHKDQQASGDSTAIDITPKDKLANLQVGETATFDKYSVTVTSVDTSEEGVVAHVKVAAHDSDLKLKTKYLKGGTQSGSSFPNGTINVPAKSEVEGTVSYSELLNKLKWDNWGNEATWKFDNAMGDAATAERDALRTAHENAVENAKKYFDAPSSVDFPWVDFAQKRTGKTITENGSVKYKNAYGMKMEDQYWLIYDDSGTLTTFKLGDLSLI